jgi:hypothetical protein
VVEDGSDVPDDPSSEAVETPTTERPTMADTKAEIVDAAVAWGFGTEDELNELTKQQLLDLWDG